MNARMMVEFIDGSKTMVEMVAIANATGLGEPNPKPQVNDMVVGMKRIKVRAGGMDHLSGKCMCGAVTWTYSGETTRNLVCHCADCQRATSSPFTAFLGMNPKQLHWDGKIEHYESSPGTYRGFCPLCGTRLYFRSEKWPEETHVHAATLANPNEYRPDAQVVMRSRAGWLDCLKSIPAYEEFQKRPANQSDSKKKA